MKVDRLRLFLGKPIEIKDNIKLYSPTIDEISEIGEAKYGTYLLFATFDFRNIVRSLGQYFQINNDVLIELENFSEYDVLTDKFLGFVLESLSFFTKKEVYFDLKDDCFLIENNVFINRSNYKNIAEIIKIINCIDKKEKELKFKNETARKMYEQLLKLREKYKKNDNIDLKDILSVLCNAPDNGINVFNSGDLTIYQVYEHLERLYVKERFNRLLGVWQNGLLKDANQLKDWIVKIKL